MKYGKCIDTCLFTTFDYLDDSLGFHFGYPQDLFPNFQMYKQMIPTLSSNSYLFKVHQNREAYQEKLDKRKTFLLVCLITICVTIATTLWIVYG